MITASDVLTYKCLNKFDISKCIQTATYGNGFGKKTVKNNNKTFTSPLGIKISF